MIEGVYEPPSLRHPEVCGTAIEVNHVWGPLRRVIALVLLLVATVGLGITSANANNHGLCISYDYNDDGDKYCDNFETIEEIKQTHIRLRKYCRAIKEMPGGKCEAIVYFKAGEKFFYDQIRICLNNKKTNESNFMHINNATYVDEDLSLVNSLEEVTHDESCHKNRRIFRDFPYPGAPVFFVIKNGVGEYGGKMSDN